jgi:cyclopropane fatty-acyl-phospholipid synthase-like methyltransferase
LRIESRYLNKAYLDSNPNWDRIDAPWKADHVSKILKDHNILPEKLCDVGCGAGDIAAILSSEFPKAQIVGYDVSPQLLDFWPIHNGKMNLELILGEFNKINNKFFDVLLMLDVFEHVRDPFTFLEDVKKWSSWFVFHIPLDLSMTTVARGYPLIKGREKSGHIHYYTKDLALATLRDSGYEIVEWRYTGASLNSPQRSLLTRLVAPLRQALYFFNRDLAVRLIGGDTLLVLARPLKVIS